jgi:hypothetical protein
MKPKKSGGSELQIEPPTNIWEDKLGIEYTIRREFIPIDAMA